MKRDVFGWHCIRINIIHSWDLLLRCMVGIRPNKHWNRWLESHGMTYSDNPSTRLCLSKNKHGIYSFAPFPPSYEIIPPIYRKYNHNDPIVPNRIAKVRNWKCSQNVFTCQRAVILTPWWGGSRSALNTSCSQFKPQGPLDPFQK